MKTITSWDDALYYVHHLGFSPGGPIGYQQAELCRVADTLCAAAAVPFRVQFQTHKSGEFCYPWLGTFRVWPGGRKPSFTVRPPR